jgi:hypothetical protein
MSSNLKVMRNVLYAVERSLKTTIRQDNAIRESALLSNLPVSEPFIHM